METNRPSRDRFIDLRVFLALALCSAGLFLATLSLAATSPSGSWSIVPSPNNSAGRTNLLEDVTCITESDCWAVGHYYGTKATQTLIQHWDGKSWSIVPSPNAIANGPNQHNDLTSVACTSSSDCWAVGTHRDNQIPRTLILKWDGKSWSIVPSPDNGPGANYLSDVTCTSANDCWAVGSYAYDQVVFGQVSATMIQRWDGRAWSIVSSPNYTDDSNLLVKEMNNGLASVTCTSASDCWAVGGARGFRQPSRTLIARWNGSTWSLVPSPSTGAENDHGLVSVACASPSDCWAVGSFDESGTGEEPQTLIARWTGTEWSLGPSPDPNGTIGLLGDITCTSSSECWAIGGRSEGSKSLTLIQRWDGTMWSTVPSPNVPDVNQNRLSGLTCASATDCWAVGAALGFDIKTMTQRYTASTNVAPAQLQNISTRLRVQTGDNTLIGGFIVTGSAPKKIILRAIGP
ncbi:MAG TPA: hypothetical protein VK993_03575, partial [Chthoniobacterales bacterium]|nr:hypothetical protein [Chthoniobacterales bacterium]